MTVVEGWRLRSWGEEPRWEAVDVPDPRPGEVAVSVEACGVGLTVLNCMNGNLGDSPDLLPLTPGHEMVGRVVAAGEHVSHPAVGDRVMAYFYLSCFRCRNCVAGLESRCENLAGWYGVNRDGGYAPLTVLPSGNALVLEHDIPAEQATVIPDAVATPVHVCNRIGLEAGERVAVVGAGGGVGAHMIQVARVRGAEVVGLDIGDDKLELVGELGATPVSAARLESVDLKELGGEVDAVIDLVGNRDTLAWSISKPRIGGRLCVLTTFPGVDVAIEPRQLVFKEASVVGSRYASRAELLTAADLVAAGSVRPVLGGVADAQDVRGLHAALRSGRLRGRGAIVWS